MTDKQNVLAALATLPEDVGVEDAIDRLCFMAEVKQGLRELDAGQGTPHDGPRSTHFSNFCDSPAAKTQP